MDLAKHFLAYAGAATLHPTRKTNVVVPAEPVTSKSFMTPSSQTEAEITGRTILVVDDEPSILKCVQRVLEHADYDVITSPSGSHALEIIEGRRPKIDLVLTDMVMPGLIDGLTLASKIHRKNPKLPVLFITGVLPGESPRCGIEDRLLQKPFSPKQLVQFIDSHFQSRILLTPLQ